MRIISSAPTRISLFGGGTDLPVFYENYGGLVISLAINLRQHIEIDTNKDEILHMPEGGSRRFYEAFLQELGVKASVFSDFDGKIESGTGSSASAAVALVAALAKARGIYLNKPEIADKAWDIEVNRLGLYGGKQDQFAAVYGGMNIISFNKNGVFTHNIIRQQADFIARHIVLFDTGKTRKSKKIQENLLNLTDGKLMALSSIKETATIAKQYLQSMNILRLGELLQKSWEMKKASNPEVSNKEIDDLYEAGLCAGAEGGKLMGSGGGGFMFFICKPELKAGLITQMESLGCKYWDFSIDYNGVETRIL